MPGIESKPPRFLSNLDTHTESKQEKGVATYKKWTGFVLSLLGYTVGCKVSGKIEYVNKNSLIKYIERNTGYRQAYALKDTQLKSFVETCTRMAHQKGLDVDVRNKQFVQYAPREEADFVAHDLKEALSRSIATSTRLTSKLMDSTVWGTEPVIHKFLDELAKNGIKIDFTVARDNPDKRLLAGKAVLQEKVRIEKKDLFYTKTKTEALYGIDPQELIDACVERIRKKGVTPMQQIYKPALFGMLDIVDRPLNKKVKGDQAIKYVETRLEKIEDPGLKKFLEQVIKKAKMDVRVPQWVNAKITLSYKKQDKNFKNMIDGEMLPTSKTGSIKISTQSFVGAMGQLKNHNSINYKKGLRFFSKLSMNEKNHILYCAQKNNENLFNELFKLV